jgi:hypothetical protein
MYSMFVRFHVILSGLALGSVVFACTSTPSRPPAADVSPRASADGELAGAPDWLRKGCHSYWSDDRSAGLCGVGSASGTRNPSLALSGAAARARTEIARALETSVMAMLKDYQATTTGGEEFGRSAADEQHLIDVGRQLTDVRLVGAEQVAMWISASGATYALVVLEADKYQRAVWNMRNLSADVRKAVAQNTLEAFGGNRTPPVASGAVGPLELVSLKEIEALPLDTNIAWGTTAELSNGPVINLESPSNNGIYRESFPIKVQFLVGDNGIPVDMDSLKLEYKRAWGIDITSRVSEYVTESGIEIAEAELPRGKHSVEIRIEDEEQNRSSRLLSVTIK